MLRNVQTPTILLALSTFLLACGGGRDAAPGEETAVTAEEGNPTLPQGVEVALTPETPDPEAGRSLRWSPYGKQLPLIADGDALETTLALGTQGPAFGLRLSKSGASPYFDRLSIDTNHDGEFQPDETLETTPSENRNKFWSSFETTLELPVTDPWSGETARNPYPLGFWYVEDPRIQEQDTVIRFSRDGWMEGTATLDGVEAVVMVTENAMDGVFDEEDSWALAGADSAAEVFQAASARGLTEHAWLFEEAYVVTEIDPSGRRVVVAPFDPGMTRAEEEEINDHLAVDRNAPRSGRTVAFLHDFEEAEAAAQEEGKPLLIDFETTWCGPCKIMDQWVWTADAVVDAAATLIAVKVDGDERLDLKERFGVEGFPTMILLGPDGEELNRASGYVNVESTAEFLTSRPSPGTS